jgi:hypothetical protein
LGFHIKDCLKFKKQKRLDTESSFEFLVPGKRLLAIIKREYTEKEMGLT